MRGHPKKQPREKDMTSRYMSADFDNDHVEEKQRFSQRSKNQQSDKTQKTNAARDLLVDESTLKAGEVIQVYSRFCDVESNGETWLCTTRKTLNQVSGADIVVGDLVKFSDLGTKDESGRPEGVIAQVQVRTTVLTRADSFKQLVSHPIVANAQQMLIVASLREPFVKWGLIDRMVIAAKSGGLDPILCLNKMDLKRGEEDKEWVFARDALAHYATFGVRSVTSSVEQNQGLNDLREILHNHTTVVAGHSGVGKSSLIRAVESTLDLRIGEISGYTGKGRHTTTSARRYVLPDGGYVIDTPGVKLFGLWGVTQENLAEYFPDLHDADGPTWRRESYERILASVKSD